MIGAIANWLDDRVAFSRSGSKITDYIFPEQWSFMLGEVAAYSFLILVVTGVFLTFFFVPDGSSFVHYHGAYAPLVGEKMHPNFDSALRISFDVRGGLLCRQAHHWAALIFIGSIVVHMGRVYFTGAYRRPRELNWIVGTLLLLMAIMNGYLGYSLPGDLESGLGVRIGYSILESIPIVGNYLAVMFFQGNFPGSGIWVERFFIFHVFVVPMLIFALLGLHILLIIKPHHTQFYNRHKRGDNVVGAPLWPSYMFKSTALFFIVFAVILFLAATVQIDPFWQYGTFVPYAQTDATQPDWYLGWLEGSLRIWPNWEWTFPGHMIAEQFWSAAFLPAVTWIGLWLVPFADRWLTGDKREHHLLARPREHPGRTGFGVAMLVFYAVLLLAGGDDVLAAYFGLNQHAIVWFFRVALVVAPFVAYAVTWKICRELGRSPIVTSRQRWLYVSRTEDRSFALHDLPVPPEENEPEPIGLESAESLHEGGAETA